MSIKELSKYEWGLGIEHEMHIFHTPLTNKSPKKIGLVRDTIQDFILFNSEAALKRIFDAYENNKINLSDDDYKFLKSVPFEKSGRTCNGVSVIKKIPIEMPEFITWQPFCSIQKDRDIKNMTMDIVEAKKKFYKLLLLDKTTQNLVKKYGAFTEYPFGMTRYLKVPIQEKKGLYTYEVKKDGKPKLLPEYNGSYHITFTLPHSKKTTNSEFISMHQNFANQLQWLEPLLLAAYFTGDEYSPGSVKKRVRGSFRVMIIGWGNFAGTDVRLFKKGIGRYAKTPTYWRKKLYFEDVDKLKPCYKPSPQALKEGGITSLSSDFRTFGSTDPKRPEHRESGMGMTIPNGVEFRIFDHFPDKYIESLIMLISLVAENSRVTHTEGYVYQNKTWIKALHEIMRDGYKTKISQAYINLLRAKLGLKINTKSQIAYDVFKKIYDELWEKNIHGKWSKIFNGFKEPLQDEIIVPQINKRGWQFAFMIKCNRNKKLLHKFNFLSKYLNYVKSMLYSDFKIAILDIFGNNWVHDVDDIAYFYQTLNFAELTKNKNGTIKKINIVENIREFKDFDTIISNEFLDSYIKNIFGK